MKTFTRILRWLLAFILLSTMTGCLYWLHAYQTYLQMDEFDRYFSVVSKDDFTVHFKKPKLFSEDFVSLAKLHASSEEQTADGKRWRYWFRKIDKDGKQVAPEVSFYLDLAFNKEDKITDWTFSNLFLQIAPPEFLEASFRSLGGAEINEEKKQLKAKADQLEKIAALLPKKSQVVKQLGEPLEITQEEKQEVYLYHFRLEAKEIEEGYEDRALSEVRLMFDKETAEMVKMSGRFAGLKISINYRDYQDDKDKTVAGL
ncbi:hypothetical protein [Methylomonas koyamae]|uniref:Uncharacterized protein n=1 Tax=Methylomonas koyamae TaxID=702114 RepID=A0A291IFV1_9GAMM|nr:hypothetical protein [Methylomonas koyamae]ATG89071.1 hypothetical protein MKLM6_0797 [Methylomonas koyamae]OAI29491.1 hypothetical protein A1356_03935 [Methylomonas koyamae]WNB76727.1 hypothetical protein RI210_03895 [Methylomonas koyamae]